MRLTVDVNAAMAVADVPVPELSFLCCCWLGSMGLVFSVTVVIPEGGESGVFGRIGVGCPVGVPCGDVFVWICALIVAPVADCM